MTQRYWVPFVPGEWSLFDEETWATFLLEPAGLNAYVMAASGPAASLAVGIVAKSGSITAHSGGAATQATGTVHVHAKTGGAANQSGNAATIALGRVGYGATVSAASLPAGTAAVGKRVHVGFLLAQSGEARAGSTASEAQDGSILAQSGDASTVAMGKALTAIVGAILAQSGDAAAVAGGDRLLIATCEIVECLHVMDAQSDLIRTGTNSIWYLQPGMWQAMVKSRVHTWGCKRAKGEIEVFDDDRDVELLCGGYRD